MTARPIRAGSPNRRPVTASAIVTNASDSSASENKKGSRIQLRRGRDSGLRIDSSIGSRDAATRLTARAC